MSVLAGLAAQPRRDSCDVVDAALSHARRFLNGRGNFTFEPVEAHSNFNYLYRVYDASDAEASCCWLKVADAMPRKMGKALPRARVFAEADTARLFRECVGHLIEVPRIIYVDRATHSFLMTDVGASRRNGLEVLADDYPLYRRAVQPLAEAVARVHVATRGDRPEAAHEQELREFAYCELMGPGIRSLAPAHADSLLERLAATRECLNHSDLWAKNVLIGPDQRLALIDYEGAMRGDPVFDLATLLAAALVPWFQTLSPDPDASWDGTRNEIMQAYARGLNDRAWQQRIFHRLPGAMAVMLGARCAGPFAYPLTDQARAALGQLCSRLAREARNGTTVEWTPFVERALLDWRQCARRPEPQGH